MQNHYTYLIRNKNTRELYIGVRSCSCDPAKDTKYMSSSATVKQAYKQNPNVFSKRILRQFSTRKDALNEEIKLHQKYNVDNNPRFLNKAKQYSTGFSNAGRRYTIDPFTEEHKQKLSEAAKKRNGKSRIGKKHSEESKEKIRQAAKKQKNRVHGFKGKTHSEETKNKISKLGKGRKWFNNGDEEHLYFPGNEPAGYILGRI